jgi:hypothetical protein
MLWKKCGGWTCCQGMHKNSPIQSIDEA